MTRTQSESQGRVGCSGVQLGQLAPPQYRNSILCTRHYACDTPKKRVGFVGWKVLGASGYLSPGRWWNGPGCDRRAVAHGARPERRESKRRMLNGWAKRGRTQRRRSPSPTRRGGPRLQSGVTGRIEGTINSGVASVNLSSSTRLFGEVSGTLQRPKTA